MPTDPVFGDYVWQCEAKVCRVAKKRPFARWPREYTTDHDEWLRNNKRHPECGTRRRATK